MPSCRPSLTFAVPLGLNSYNTKGTFLVRFSTNATHPGAFTVTRVAGGPSIGHIRITRSEDGKGRCVNESSLVSLGSTRESDSLRAW